MPNPKNHSQVCSCIKIYGFRLTFTVDISETGLEKIIVDWLVLHNGYEQETPHAFNKDFALVDRRMERIHRP